MRLRQSEILPFDAETTADGGHPRIHVRLPITVLHPGGICRFISERTLVVLQTDETGQSTDIPAFRYFDLSQIDTVGYGCRTLIGNRYGAFQTADSSHHLGTLYGTVVDAIEHLAALTEIPADSSDNPTCSRYISRVRTIVNPGPIQKTDKATRLFQGSDYATGVCTMADIGQTGPSGQSARLKPAVDIRFVPAVPHFSVTLSGQSADTGRAVHGSTGKTVFHLRLFGCIRRQQTTPKIIIRDLSGNRQIPDSSAQRTEKSCSHIVPEIIQLGDFVATAVKSAREPAFSVFYIVTDWIPIFPGFGTAQRAEVQIGRQQIRGRFGLDQISVGCCQGSVVIDSRPHQQQISQRSDQERIFRRSRTVQSETRVDTRIEFHGERCSIVFMGTHHRKVRRQALVHIACGGVHTHRETASVCLGRQNQKEIGRLLIVEHQIIHLKDQAVASFF